MAVSDTAYNLLMLIIGNSHIILWRVALDGNFAFRGLCLRSHETHLVDPFRISAGQSQHTLTFFF